MPERYGKGKETMPYRLTENYTTRDLPTISVGLDLLRFCPRNKGESFGFDNGGDIALLIDADGKTLAVWTFEESI